MKWIMPSRFPSRPRACRAILAVGIAACGGLPQPAPVVPDFAAKTCPAPRLDFCTVRDCGGNSPIINSFPINGLSKDEPGACNAQGVQLVPRSLQGGACGSGAELALDAAGGRLVGRRDGAVVCKGEQLTGATFIVRSFAAATLELTVAGVRQIQSHAGTAIEGYRIESAGASACEPATAERIRSQLGLLSDGPPETPRAELPVPVGYRVGPSDDLVIAVDGPLYDWRGRLVGDSRKRWFNLACAGDALAKRTVYELYAPNDDARNETALRMLTANYCGKPYTVPGITVEWLHPTGFDFLEAKWRGGKAVCIDTPRLMKLQTATGISYPPSQLPPQLQPAGCEGGSCDEVHWTKALLAECQMDHCQSAIPDIELESYSIKTGDHIGFARPSH